MKASVTATVKKVRLPGASWTGEMTACAATTFFRIFWFSQVFTSWVWVAENVESHLESEGQGLLLALVRHQRRTLQSVSRWNTADFGAFQAIRFV